MNEILKKRIETKAVGIGLDFRDTIVSGGSNRNAAEAVATLTQTAANWMAEWLLEHLWIGVEEALPEFEGNFSDYCIIRTEDGWCAVTMYYRTSEKEYWWNFEKTKVTHWMPIPKLKEGEK